MALNFYDYRGFQPKTTHIRGGSVLEYILEKTNKKVMKTIRDRELNP